MFLPSHPVYMEESSEPWLVQRCLQEADVKLFCGMLEGLTFLPKEDVDEGMTYLQEGIPDGFEPLLQYFDNMIHLACSSGSIPRLSLVWHSLIQNFSSLYIYIYIYQICTLTVAPYVSI